MQKKLQVFVSSTYTDLIEERQAAVQAILDAGHIPAGMELFKAGKSQMKTIHKWIDESDVYMLILGGRYGSIEEESGLSYTELEYKYALSKNIPVFTVVLDDNFLFTKAASKDKDTIFEKDNTDKYKVFKEYVKTNIVKFANNIDQISSIIHSHLNVIANDPEYDLVGWVRGNSDNISNEYSKTIPKIKVGDYYFSDLIELFSKKNLPYQIDIKGRSHSTNNALDIFIYYYNRFCVGVIYDDIKNIADIQENFICTQICPYFMSFDLIEQPKKIASCSYKYQISKQGLKFYSLLETNGFISSQ